MSREAYSGWDRRLILHRRFHKAIVSTRLYGSRTHSRHCLLVRNNTLGLTILIDPSRIKGPASSFEPLCALHGE